MHGPVEFRKHKDVGPWPLEAAVPAADEEREADTSKATEDTLGCDDDALKAIDAKQMTACIGIKRAIFDALQNTGRGARFFSFSGNHK